MEIVKVNNKSTDITDNEYLEMVKNFRQSELLDIDYLIGVISEKPKKDKKSAIRMKTYDCKFEVKVGKPKG